MLIPARVAQYVAPVIASHYHRTLSTWDDVGFGLDFEPAKTKGFNNIYVRVFEPKDLLDSGVSAVCWDRVDFMRQPKTGRSGDAAFTAKKAETIFGLALWWTTELAEGISLGTGPADPKTHWEQLYLPVPEPK